MSEEKDTSVIPPGHYCYVPDMEKNANKDKDDHRLYIKTCPYWSIRKDKPEQANGYCSFMEKGDWEINEDATVIDMKTGEVTEVSDLPFGVGLLWDQVKECGENIKDDL